MSTLGGLKFVFSGIAKRMLVANGIGVAGVAGLDPEWRKYALKLNHVFSLLMDHSRCGTMEVQTNKADFVDDVMTWPLWVDLFESIGFAIYYEGLRKGADFAINMLGYGVPRVTNRELTEDENTRYQAMMQAMKDHGEAVAKFTEPPPNAADLEPPSLEQVPVSEPQ